MGFVAIAIGEVESVRRREDERTQRAREVIRNVLGDLAQGRRI